MQHNANVSNTLIAAIPKTQNINMFLKGYPLEAKTAPKN